MIVRKAEISKEVDRIQEISKRQINLLELLTLFQWTEEAGLRDDMVPFCEKYLSAEQQRCPHNIFLEIKSTGLWHRYNNIIITSQLLKTHKTNKIMPRFHKSP